MKIMKILVFCLILTTSVSAVTLPSGHSGVEGGQAAEGKIPEKDIITKNAGFAKLNTPPTSEDSVCQNITIEKTRLHYIAHGTYTRLSNVTCYGRAVYVMIWPSAQTYYLYYLEVNTLSLWALGQTVCGDNVIMYRISSLTPHIQAASEWQEYIVVTNGFEAVSDVSISCQTVTSLCGSMMLEGTSWHSAAMGVYRIDEQTCFTQPMYRLEWPDSGKQRYMYLLPGLYFGEDRESARDSWVVSDQACEYRAMLVLPASPLTPDRDTDTMWKEYTVGTGFVDAPRLMLECWDELFCTKMTLVNSESHAALEGDYTLTSSVECLALPVYTMNSAGYLYARFSDGNLSWAVGESPCDDVTFMSVTSPSASPDRALVTWEEWDTEENKFIENPDLDVLCQEYRSIDSLMGFTTEVSLTTEISATTAISPTIKPTRSPKYRLARRIKDIILLIASLLASY